MVKIREYWLREYRNLIILYGTIILLTGAVFALRIIEASPFFAGESIRALARSESSPHLPSKATRLRSTASPCST